MLHEVRTVLIKKKIQLLAFICLVVFLSALFIGGHQPESGKLFSSPWDKLVHFLFYGTLTVFAGIAFPKIKLPLLILLIAIIGSTDEIHQMFVPGRQPSFDDLLADITGCLPALFLVLWARNKLQ